MKYYINNRQVTEQEYFGVKDPLRIATNNDKHRTFAYTVTIRNSSKGF